MDAPPPAPALNAAQQAFLGKLGTERENIKKLFYLITFSRILLETLAAAGGGLRDAASLTRQQIAAAVRNAFNNPIAPAGGGGRPRAQTGNIMKKLMVFLEQHASMASMSLYCNVMIANLHGNLN